MDYSLLIFKQLDKYFILYWLFYCIIFSYFANHRRNWK